MKEHYEMEIEKLEKTINHIANDNAFLKSFIIEAREIIELVGKYRCNSKHNKSKSKKWLEETRDIK